MPSHDTGTARKPQRSHRRCHKPIREDLRRDAEEDAQRPRIPMPICIVMAWVFYAPFPQPGGSLAVEDADRRFQHVETAENAHQPGDQHRDETWPESSAAAIEEPLRHEAIGQRDPDDGRRGDEPHRAVCGRRGQSAQPAHVPRARRMLDDAGSTKRASP